MSLFEVKWSKVTIDDVNINLIYVFTIFEKLFTGPTGHGLFKKCTLSIPFQKIHTFKFVYIHFLREIIFHVWNTRS